MNLAEEPRMTTAESIEYISIAKKEAQLKFVYQLQPPLAAHLREK